MTKFITIFCLVTAFAVAAAAQTGTNGIDTREKNQKQRIVNGVKSGDLTFKETGKLLKQQAEIRKFERKAKADGTVTLGERFRLHRELNQAGRNIKRKKNN
jgi:hypothetical protein